MKNRFWTITAKSNSEIEILLYEMIGRIFGRAKVPPRSRLPRI